MASQDLERVALTLVADRKGILAADETVPTLTRRFDTLGIKSTEQSRRTYREMLFTSPGAAEFISGAIMYDETIRQKSSRGTAAHGGACGPGRSSRDGGGRNGDTALLVSARARRCSWYRLSVWRSKRTSRNNSSECNQPAARSEALENQFLLRPGASGSGAGGLAWPG